MKEIALTQGKVAIVDDADYESLNQLKWYAQKTCSGWYAARRVGKEGDKILILMHREILKTPANKETDHIDGNGLNNQRHNLRAATRAQNQHNQRKQKGTSKFKGVSRRRDCDRWQVQIRVDKRDIRLGLFSSETEAAKAYDTAAQKYFGEFAHLNFKQAS